MSATAETVLIQRCRKRDKAAFGELVEQHKRQAYSFAFSYLRNADDALSVSQDAFVRAWKAFDTFAEGRLFRPWLFSIVKNLALNLLDKKKRLREVSLDEAMEESGYDIPDNHPDALGQLEQKETRAQIWKAIMELKPEFRDVIVLKHFHDLSYEEIAEALDIPRGTVMSRLFHARKALRNRLVDVM